MQRNVKPCEDSDRCTDYSNGFCPEGPSCLKKHVRLGPSEIPKVLSKKYIQKVAEQFDKITDFYNNCELFSSDLFQGLIDNCNESLYN